jgi:hypothetical protein
VLKARCQTCHASPTQYGASAPLVTFDDLQNAGPGASASKKVYELVKARIHDASRPMPPSLNPLLTDKLPEHSGQDPLRSPDLHLGDAFAERHLHHGVSLRKMSSRRE